MKPKTVFLAGGKSLCVTIPPHIKYALGIVPGTEMTVECVNGKIIYTPIKDTLKPYIG